MAVGFLKRAGWYEARLDKVDPYKLGRRSDLNLYMLDQAVHKRLKVLDLSLKRQVELSTLTLFSKKMPNVVSITSTKSFAKGSQ